MKTLVLLLLTTLPLTQPAATAPPSGTVPPTAVPLEEGPRVEWSTAHGGNGHSYEVVAAPGGINWDDAEAWATAHGGYLTTIITPAEDKFVFNLLKDQRFEDYTLYHSFWIGGMQPLGSQEPGGNWKWVNNDGPVTINEWLPGQPDNLGGNENRVAMFGAFQPQAPGAWDDRAKTDLVHGFIVEFDPPRSPPSLQVASHKVLYIVGFVAVMGLLFYFNRPKPPAPQRAPE